MTLRQAAALAGTSASRLAEIERGMSYHTDHATRPSPELVDRLAGAYGVEPRVLRAEAGFPELPSPPLSPGATKLLALYDSLSASRQRLALRLVRALVDEESEASS